MVDGNVERVIARLYAVDAPLPAAKQELKSLAAGLVGPDRPGDWAQALMDLGATICRPKAPLCDRCPLAEGCAARASGTPEAWPRRSAKAERPRRYGAAYVLSDGARVGLVRRPPKGLLGGMLGLPTSDWGSAPLSAEAQVAAAPRGEDWRALGAVEHVFTHFSLTLQVWRGRGRSASGDLIWLPAEEAAQGLPSVFRKALEAGLNGLL